MVGSFPASEHSSGWASGDSPDRRAPLSAPGPALANRFGVEIVLDLSRLLSRMLRCSPSTSDRIELAYARALKTLVPNQLRYAAIHPNGTYGRLPASDVEAFLDRMEGRWESLAGHCSWIDAHRFAARQCWTLRPRRVPPALERRVLLQVSPHHLHRHSAVAQKLRREHARFVCLVTDPHSDLSRPQHDVRTAQRLQTIEALADGILVPSRSALDTLIYRTGERLRHLPVRIERLGVNRGHVSGQVDARQQPYFLCVGTIEPRTNHLMLLNVWRSIVEAMGGEQAPRLLLVGCRGDQHRALVDMLGRGATLEHVVQALPLLPDRELHALAQGARAVLEPAFAADSGMALAAALAGGAPVLASDIPEHREAGGSIPEYIDPIDGDGWRRAILAYQAPASPRRILQLARLSDWQPITWQEHVKTALSLIEEVAAC